MMSPRRTCPVRHEVVADAAAAIAELVHQQVVADQQRVLHGFGGNLERLHDEGDDKNGDDDRGQQRLQRADVSAGGRFSFTSAAAATAWWSLGVPVALGSAVRLDGHGAKIFQHLAGGILLRLLLVDPSARPMNSALPDFKRLQPNLHGECLVVFRPALLHQR